jgi:hypothetical protein
MLASTIQFTNTPPNPEPPTGNHRPDQVGDVAPGPEPGTEEQPHGLSLQDPIACHQTTRSRAAKRSDESSTFPPMSSATTHSVVQRL